MSQFTPEQDSEKLQKVLARAGIGSRREMEVAITQGKAIVNGKVASLGDRVVATDQIEFDGKRIRVTTQTQQPLKVLLYNKPEGQICAVRDPEGRRTVYENLPFLKHGRWVSVGRLDFNTTGVLLFTNDGELANTLMHPSSNIDREYLVRIQGSADDDALERMKEGILLDDGVAKFTDIKPGKSEGSNRWYYCVVMEGRNREVRRLWESQGYRVSRLKRVRYGNIFIPSKVRMGQWIELTEKEIGDLCQTAGQERPDRSRFAPAQQGKRPNQRARSGRGGGSSLRSKR